MPQKSPLHVTPSAARGLGWWVQADSGEPNPRFLVAPLLGMTVLRQGPAQATATGNLAEVDLEMYQGYLVDDVNLGDRDVKIDAEDGTVSGHGTFTITGNRFLSAASSAV